MNPCPTVPSILQLGASLLILAGLLETTSFAAPIPLPDWVKPIESSLPRLSPEVISEVDEIRAFIDRNAESYGPEIDAKIDSHLRRLVELQEQGDQARIWQYLKATSDPYPDRTLIRLGSDRDLAAWLLPIVRFRIEWLKESMHDPDKKGCIEDFFRKGEIEDVASYLCEQGEFSDIENLNSLVDESIKLKIKFTSEFKPSDQKKLGAAGINGGGTARECS